MNGLCSDLGAFDASTTRMVRSSPSNQISATLFSQTHVSWWLAALGQHVFWALLREKEAGTAEVIDHNGQTLIYDSLDRARAALL